MKNQSWIVAFAMSVLLGACAGPGEIIKIPVTMPGGAKATIVAHDQKVPDWLLSQDKLALNYIVKDDINDNQLAAIAEAERACHIYTKTVRPNNLVAVLSQGVLFASAGYIGVGLGARAFAGAIPSQYARYGMWASGVSGTANGIATLGGQTYTFENCGREILGLFPGFEVHVVQRSPY
jgi:hypothetical protein